MVDWQKVLNTVVMQDAVENYQDTTNMGWLMSKHVTVCVRVCVCSSRYLGGSLNHNGVVSTVSKQL